MTFLPIVERELRVAARRPGTYRARLLVAVIATLIGSSIFLIEEGMPSELLGTYIFRGLAALSLVYCLASGRRSTADCLSEEKREGTLGLLFLTDLRGYDVVSGKLAATSLNAFYGLMAVFPVMAIPLLMGGVTNGEFWRMALVLVDTFFFSLAVGIFGSSWTREARNAFAANFMMLLGFILFVPAIAGMIAVYTNGNTFVPQLLFTCPGYAYYLAFDAPYLAHPEYFWCTTGILFGLSLLGVTFAARIAPRAWQDKPARRKPRGWREWWHAWSFGPAAGRAAYRKQLLDQNAFFWLAARAARKTWHVWVFLGLMALWAVCGWLVERELWLDLVAVTLALIVNFTLKLWIALEAGQQLAEDKKAGALELLLTTPLELRDIFRGQMLALRRQFVWPLFVVVVVEVGFSFHRSQEANNGEMHLVWAAGIVMLVLDIAALTLVSMSLALTARSPNHALLGTVLRILIAPWIGFFAVMSGMTLWTMLWNNAAWSPGLGYYTALWFVFGLLADGVFGWRAWQRWQRAFTPRPKPPGVSVGLRQSAGVTMTNRPGAARELIGRLPKRPRLRRALQVCLLLLVGSFSWYAYRALFPPPPPVAVVSVGQPLTQMQIAEGQNGVYLLLPDGSLWAWGQPEGMAQWRVTPARVGHNSDWEQISTVGSHAMAIKHDGSLWEWGGGLGPQAFGINTSPETPALVSSDKNWIAAGASLLRAAAVRSDGTLWTFAWNMRRTRDSVAIASRVGNGTNWLGLATDQAAILARSRDGTLWVWGNLPVPNRPLFFGGPSDYPKPAQVCAETNWVELSGSFPPLALNNQGELWQPLTAQPDARASTAGVGQLLATNVVVHGYALVDDGGPTLFTIHGDGSLWRVPKVLKTFNGSPPSGGAETWQRVGKRNDWVWLSGTGTTGFGLTADNTLWVFGRDFGRVGTPDIATRWRAFNYRLRQILSPAARGVRFPNSIPIQSEPRQLMRLVGTNGAPLPKLNRLP